MVNSCDVLLDGLSPSLRQLTETGVRRFFPKRTRFICEGDEGTSIYVVLSGSVKAFTSDADGKEFVFGVYERDSIIGEMALDGQPRSASVEAITDVHCVIIGIDALRARILVDPEFTMTLIRTLIQRSRNTTTFARRLALESAYERLVGLLRELSVVRDGETVIPLLLSQQDIAHRIGTSRDMVSKLFKDLVKGEYLTHEKKQITLLRELPKKW
jgi:CRP/FNR family cyclic AMP-dependent transcriptional regulator